MHYYMIQPVYDQPDGRTIDLSLGDHAISNIIESAYWTVQGETNVYDKFINHEHKDFFIFDTIEAFNKAADILALHMINFNTNIVQKSTPEEADFQTDNNYYKVIVPGKPDAKGGNNYYPRTYYDE
ncbi:hypothetical protein [Tepidibacillus sp. LV47]|uniref:hypothetical protein n=1 Tax=Tepidibacillus sp. LV47 TaxID=3398228 RepID=UPI003AAE6B1F